MRALALLLAASAAFGQSTNGTTSQTITFSGTQTAVSAATYGATYSTLVATASSGLAVTYTLTGPGYISSGRRYISAAGQITVCADQAGNATYAPAAEVCHGFTVAPAPLTVTATSLSFHAGDALPPNIWAATGWKNGDNVDTASTGKPTLSTAITAASSAGASGAISISAGNFATTNYTVSYVAGTMSVLTADGTGARNNSYSYPANAMVNVKTACGVAGDGTTDDTAAINTCLNQGRDFAKDSNGNYLLTTGTSPHTYCNDYFRSPTMYYFPAGTYRVTGNLTFTCGAEMAIRGAGGGQTVFRLDDRLPAFNGSNPLAMLLIPSAVTLSAYGNIAFRNFVTGITFDTGVGNTKAIALQGTFNNNGAITDVVAVSDSSDAYDGISLTNAWNGPMLLKNDAVYGFTQGIDMNNQTQYSAAASHITLEGQTLYGIADNGQGLAVEQLFSQDAVPTINNLAADIAVINSTLTGGTTNALVSGTSGTYHVRNVTTTGYTNAIYDGSQSNLATPGGAIAEYFSGAAKTAFPAAAAGLGLPIQESPIITDPAGSTWCQLSTTDPSQWATQMAACTSGTAYLPAGEYVLPSGSSYPVVVPGNIQHIHFFNAGFTPANVSIQVTVSDNTTTSPLMVESFGTNIEFDYSGSRPVIVKDLPNSLVISGTPGNMYLEDVESGGPVQFLPGQNIWARDWDQENAPIPASADWSQTKTGQACAGAPVVVGACLPPSGVKMTCNGATFWALGFKTEKGSTAMQGTNGCKAEIYGGFFLTLQYNQQSNTTIFDFTNSSLSADIREYLYSSATDNTGVAHILKDTQNGVTQYVDPPNQNSSFSSGLIYSAGAVTIYIPVIGFGGNSTAPQGKVY